MFAVRLGIGCRGWEGWLILPGPCGYHCYPIPVNAGHWRFPIHCLYPLPLSHLSISERRISHLQEGLLRDHFEGEVPAHEEP